VKPRITLLAAIATVLSASSLWAGDVEVRTFSINVENQKAGEFRITALKVDGGGSKVSAERVVQTKLGSGWRRAVYSGLETWKNGRLQDLDARSIDDGDRREIKASIQDEKLRILVNGQRSDAPLDVWTSTWWTAPDVDRPAKEISMLEPDTGKVISARIERVGLDRLTVLGESREYTHFRIAAQNLKFDLWYDDEDHLVRASGVENKQQVVMELMKTHR
jgi:hypothetical protein